MKTAVLLACNLIIKKLKTYIVLIIQLTITILFLLLIIGRIQFIIGNENISNVFQGENACYFTPYSFMADDFDIQSELSKNGYNIREYGEIANIAFSNENNEDDFISAYGYNDCIIRYTNLQLSSGYWFSDCEIDDNYIPAIAISDKYSEGDIIDVISTIDDTKYGIKIIGALEENSNVIAFNTSASNGDSSSEYFVSKPYYDLIVPYESSVYPSIKFSENSLYNYETSDSCVIIFDDITNVGVEKYLQYYGKTTDISDMFNNYNDSVTAELCTYGLMFLIFTILSLVGIGGNNGIQNILNEHQFAIYYILGATQKECCLIEFMRGLIQIVISLITSSLAFYILRDIFYSNTNINLLSFVLVLLYLLFIFGATSGVFLHRLNRKNIITSYKRSGL